MKFIDFFAGIGGFRRGMELAGHECVGFCEFDKFATASYISMHLLTEEQRKTLEDIPIKKRQKEILKEEYRNGEWYAEVSAYSGSKLKGRVLKLSEQFPDDVKILATNKDGSIFAHVPAKYVKLRAPKILTEEQRAELIERGKSMSRSKAIDCEETSDFDSDDDNEEMFTF